MAGFFGLFNYEKEGPGVSKNAPEKKSFIRFFELFFKNFWKLTVNNIWFWLLTVLGVTSGLATAGITNITRNMAVDTHSFGTSDFFETIKKNWKQSLIAGILHILVYAVLAFDIYFFATFTQNEMKIIGIIGSCMVLFLFLIMQYYFWIILVTFRLKLSQIYKNSFKLAIVSIRANLKIIVSLLIVYAFAFLLGYIGTGITQFMFALFVLFVLPGLRFLIIQYNVFPVINKFMIEPYYKEHPDEDLELRRRLGVLSSENYDNDFEDLI